MHLSSIFAYSFYALAWLVQKARPRSLSLYIYYSHSLSLSLSFFLSVYLCLPCIKPLGFILARDAIPNVCTPQLDLVSVPLRRLDSAHLVAPVHVLCVRVCTCLYLPYVRHSVRVALRRLPAAVVVRLLACWPFSCV